MVLGAVVSLVLASPLTGREGTEYLRAGVLLAIGVVLYGVNRVLVRRSGAGSSRSTGSPTPAR